IMLGAMTSGGMMEVARKGIFNPQHFYFNEIMILFLAVMVTDIILLDIFNTLALPTSTTVSIVFEILGASLALATIKVLHNELPMTYLFNNDNPAEGIV
ncbi:inorganic phosphate transporter, partial [Ornithobacterium rhinotracheale]